MSYKFIYIIANGRVSFIKAWITLCSHMYTKLSLNIYLLMDIWKSSVSQNTYS